MADSTIRESKSTRPKPHQARTQAQGRPRQGFRINAQGLFEPDPTGRQVLAMIRDNPRVRASQVQRETGLEYYDAWTVLKNCRLYLQEEENATPAPR